MLYLAAEDVVDDLVCYLGVCTRLRLLPYLPWVAESMSSIVGHMDCGIGPNKALAEHCGRAWGVNDNIPISSMGDGDAEQFGGSIGLGSGPYVAMEAFTDLLRTMETIAVGRCHRWTAYVGDDEWLSGNHGLGSRLWRPFLTYRGRW